MSFGKLFKSYAVVTILPSLIAYAIWSDYSHTRDWKAGIQRQQKGLAAAEGRL